MSWGLLYDYREPGLIRVLHLHLQNDQRYLLLEFLGDERKELVERYIEELGERGPPPPPTASEPQRSGVTKSAAVGGWQPV